MKYRNVLLSRVLLLLMASPALLYLSERAGATLPGWFTAAYASYLSGAVVEADVKGQASLAGFSSGRLQRALEDKVENYVPMKASAILGNAALQRYAIAASNEVFGWGCYPTYYGSSYAYSPHTQSVSEMSSYDQSILPSLERFGEAVDTFARQFPESHIVIYVADRSSTSAANPVSDLVSAWTTTEEATAAIKEAVTADNVSVLANPFDNAEEYYQKYYRSDHHWRPQGAAEAANSIGAALGKNVSLSQFKDVDGPLYTGAYSRNGLCIVEDVPQDFAEDYSSEILVSGDEREDGASHRVYEDAPAIGKHYQFYDLYYWAYAQANAQGSGNLIMVNDSYGCALERPLGAEYSKTLWSNHLHSSRKTNDRLVDSEPAMEESDLVFVGHVGNCVSFLDRNPQFFAID